MTTLLHPDGTTHRLCFFPGAPGDTRHASVPYYIADEITEHREFIAFLYPPRGQDRFVLQRPDALDFVWTVWDRTTKTSYAAGQTPLQAVRNARGRLSAETSAESFQLQT